MIYTVLIILEFILFALAFVTLLNIKHWSVRGFDFPIVQLLVLSVMVAVISVIVENYQSGVAIIALVLVSSAIIYHLMRVIPYTKIYPLEVQNNSHRDSNNALTIMSFNVLMTNKKYARLLQLIKLHNPDIILLLETDTTWETAMKPLESHYQYQIKIPKDNLYGMHFYSKLPLEESEVHYIVNKEIPSISAKISLASGQKVQLYGLHPMPPSPTESADTTNRDAELLIVGKEAAKSDIPVVVFGDLNDVAWSRSTRLFKKISGLLDPRIGRGRFSTFHADYPYLRWPLDHLFHSKHFMLNDIKVLPHSGSDHFPIYVSLQFHSENNQQQESLECDSDDEEEADKNIKEAFE